MKWRDIFNCRSRQIEERKEANTSVGLADAQEQRRTAEEKLRETQNMSREVRRVSSTSRRLRQDNHFAQRITEAFGSHNG